MAASTAPAAKTAIISLFQSWPALAGVTVTWGGPTSEEEVVSEMVWLGDVELTQEWASLNRTSHPKQEQYSISATIAVRLYGTEEKPAEERMWALLSAVEDALRSDVSLGGVLSQWCEMSSATATTVPTTEGFVAKCDFKIDCQTRV